MLRWSWDVAFLRLRTSQPRTGNAALAASTTARASTSLAAVAGSRSR